MQVLSNITNFDIQYNARNFAAVKIARNTSQWRKIGTRRRRRKDRRTSKTAGNPGAAPRSGFGAHALDHSANHTNNFINLCCPVNDLPGLRCERSIYLSIWYLTATWRNKSALRLNYVAVPEGGRPRDPSRPPDSKLTGISESAGSFHDALKKGLTPTQPPLSAISVAFVCVLPRPHSVPGFAFDSKLCTLSMSLGGPLPASSPMRLRPNAQNVSSYFNITRDKRFGDRFDSYQYRTYKRKT
ncbi:hypothetical protein EVAR_14516_1 [Eumeta japonica]|uniref:Uncharacterized protein n=1 Tax=Eumeta variegata TaxID=151549 RepID=A0A4C1U3F1_EUMVA|nr:hypothetical protein EVAR_14516_1 [Eumeta japonica]